MEDCVEEVVDDDRGQKLDRRALHLSPSTNTNSSMRIELALALANRGMHGPRKDADVTSQGMSGTTKDVIEVHPPEEYAKSSVYDCTTSSKGEESEKTFIRGNNNCSSVVP